MIEVPATERELLTRTENIVGLTLNEIAQRCHFQLPKNFQQHKGWLGQLLERALGANAGSASEPDFINLHIELKTIPINAQGKPTESTFVCAVPQKIELLWRKSLVWKKLQKVLWIPISTEQEIPERKIGRGILWQPNAEQEFLLQQDWEELMEMLQLGCADQLTAKHGQVLQIRPKAANSRVLKAAVDQEGNDTLIVPRGFYLRPSFTTAIINKNG